MSIVSDSLGIVLLLVGFVGCVLPVLPGPPISFVGLVLLWWGRGWAATTFSPSVVAVLGGLAVLVTIFDFVVPAIGAKKYGASRAGVWGSLVGMLIGIIYFPPFGMLVGAFLGALLFELMVGKESTDALRAAWGVFAGTIAGIAMKLAVSAAIAFVYVRELISG